MMSLTLRFSTAYWSTDIALISDNGDWLAMFLWTNNSPGLNPTTYSAGTRESEQPIQRYSGCCPSDNYSNKWGLVTVVYSAHMTLLSRIFKRLELSQSGSLKRGNYFVWIISLNLDFLLSFLWEYTWVVHVCVDKSTWMASLFSLPTFNWSVVIELVVFSDILHL